MTNAAMTMGAIGEVRKHSGWFIALGILFLLGGVFALAMPFVAGLAVTTVFAVVLVWLGVVGWGLNRLLIWSQFRLFGPAAAIRIER